MRAPLALALLLSLAACSKKPEPTATPAPPVDAAPAAVTWEPDRSCAADADCRPAPSCCPAPCTSDVINVKDVDRAYQEMRKVFPETPADCPQAGSCPGHAYLCIQSRCKLVMEGDPDYPG